MARDLNLNSMAHFEAVARLGGVARASEELQVSASAVSQQIRFLEQQLGVRLFHREKRHLRLTIDGERLFQTTSQAFQSIREVRSAIVRQRESHNLSIRVSPSFGVRWLAPRLIEFVREHPTWDLRVDATPNFSEFETEVVDLDLRYGEGGWAGLYSNCIAHDLVLPMCAPSYLAELQALSPDPREQLAKARLIDSVKAYFRWDYWLPRNGVQGAQMSYSYRFDRSSMSVQLARDGGGVILESTTLAFEELRRGQLVPLSSQFEAIEFPAYWLVCPARHMARRSVKSFAKWVETVGARDTQIARLWLLERGHSTRFERRAGFNDAETDALDGL
ncbi:LysR substrate-binding domain-containing protein [Pseudotabrizicola formosa]|uniref:LysR substrate-binding domain-containing protein n=1 Tax=Pseudotabrizicola formosa TaxID=2030009 RepID=UPI000CD0107B|nr:LysR substrate-binding domain-containing protein [Pseudotabrizicola formosa]